MEKMDFVDWFETENLDHIKAYVFLSENGHWPNGFIPDNIVMDANWYPNLCSKLANTYVDHMSRYFKDNNEVSENEH